MEYFMLMDPYFLANGQRCIRNIIVPPNMFFFGLEDLTFLAKRCIKVYFSFYKELGKKRSFYIDS
ncbi:hypothetical protein PanWU01x14_253780 [Parasponia andersonii]|uniref:Uncharacterized protein n=1 Tax=Parasponia andersonii TaxID=3476 RepID=A0A2P5BBK3_PARAD|nr:hypothetical protein PanWU01x14_253780 [Parasponia andersonii]